MSQSVRLAQAEEALHNLITGRMARVVVDQNGERVEFTMTSVAQLRAYIETLKAGTDAGIRKPLGFIF
jgi:hypothetical protein